MINYYEICNISPSASQEEIRKTIYQLMRLWSHRTNAPQMERRQEAERMVRLLEEAEEILLDEAKRKEYDEQLRLYTESSAQELESEKVSYPSSYYGDHVQNREVTATKEKEEIEEVSATKSVVEMAQEAHQLFSSGKIEDALSIAEELVEREQNRADIWALIGRCRRRLGLIQEAVTPYVKACDLEPKNAAYVYELGDVFEEQGNLPRALEQFKRASSLDPNNLDYKYKLGKLLVQIQQYRDGLPLLEQCLNSAPDNEEYKAGLVRAYLDAGFGNWVTIDHYPSLSPGSYPISRSDLSMANHYLKRASHIQFQDPELRNQLQQRKWEIQSRKGRKFTGSWLMAVLSLIFLIITQYVNPSSLNLLFIGLPFLYIVSALTPKYRIYRNIYHDKIPKTDFAYLYEQLKMRLGSLGA